MEKNNRLWPMNLNPGGGGTLVLMIVWLITLPDGSCRVSHEITVATYNLWNVMFSWQVRQHRIAEMIQETLPDIIGFQEVRGDKSAERNQLSELKALLPQYRWIRYHPVSDVEKVPDSLQHGWEKEGLGVLSRWPIIKSNIHVLPTQEGPDRNKRISLMVQVAVADRVMVNVVVLHLSYDRMQQCGNAAEVLRHLTHYKLPNAIVLGDFNCYADFDWSVKVFTSEQTNQTALGPCHSVTASMVTREKVILKFVDAWETTSDKEDLGLTFSNMPTPGFESRPDRILISSVFEPVSTALIGQGISYKMKYRDWLVLHRFWTVLSQARASSAGEEGYPCLHDCGPRGSCRCGVCIRGNNKNSCNLPNCLECNSSVYSTFIGICFIQILTILQLLYAAVVSFKAAMHRHGKTVMQILGCNCCLCNPKLYSSPSAIIWRRSKLGILYKLWPCLRFPPLIFLAFSFACLMATFFLGQYLFSDLLETTHAIMDEELYPSDHIMLIAKVRIAT